MRTKTSTITLPTMWGDFTVTGYKEGPATHLLLSYGEIDICKPVLLRIQSSCCFGEVFGGLSCDCRSQLESSLKRIREEGSGLVIYLQQEGRGVGLASKIEAICLEQVEGFDTCEAFTHLHYPLDKRDYGIAVQMLKDIGVESLRLLTNNPLKIEWLKKAGILVQREGLVIPPTKDSLTYLQCKAAKMGHLWNATVE